ncbi:hypothetical protein [Geomesophilobacter sediminis]|uniref:Uncharacterized protein n=1 Tax=Geomesophilobacter sediminis TaxID=2798584 RepID=A0A8J7M4H7_9BACT|nr:hypothetical protein [Geomesophilobacter sediminis]MBJ6727936.1 hypothetical protein [Geomesophilobacter sediminis]
MPVAMLLQFASLISISLQKVFGMLCPQPGTAAPHSYPYVSLLELIVAPLLPEPSRRAGTVVLEGVCHSGPLQYE